MKRLLVASLLLLLLTLTSQRANAQGAAFSGTAFQSVTNAFGSNIVQTAPGAVITVCTHVSGATLTPCTGLIILYTDVVDVTTSPNPFNADSNGNFVFFAPNVPGVYDVTITGVGLIGYRYTIGTNTAGGNGIITGGVNGNLLQASSGGTATDSGIATANVVTLAGVQTLLNKTLPSPIVNGTPSGTGILGISQVFGTNLGNYARTIASFAPIDGTNLIVTKTVPLGWKATVFFQADGNLGASCTATCAVALFDGVTQLGPLHNIIALATNVPFTFEYVLTGDGASHTFQPEFQGDGTHTVTIGNSGGDFPIFIVRLEPSN